MAKPTEIVTWATDATYAVDGDAWGGDATRVDPGSTRQAEGFEPDVAPAEWANFIIGAHGDHIEYMHSILEADGAHSIPAVTRTLILHPSAFRPFSRASTPTMPSLGFSTSHNFVAISDSNQILALPLNGLLPYGAAVTRIDLLLNAGTHSTPGRLSVVAAQPDWATPAMGTESEVSGDDTSGTGDQLLTLTTAFAIGNTFLHYLVYSPETLSSGADNLKAIRIQFTDPGPRNF